MVAMKVNNKKPQDLLKSIAQSLPVILELKRRMSKKDSEVDNFLFEEYKKKEPNSYINSILM